MAHLIETYALATSSKIGRPEILEKYYPLPFDNYIVFAPVSKPSKTYDYYQDVLDILLPPLKEADICCVQVGGPNEPPFQGCYQTQGKTSPNQLAFIVKKSLLYFGADTAAAHMAGSYNIPLVELVSNNWKNVVRPFWGDKTKQIVLEPDRSKRKPSFSLDEGPNKQIDEIKPESIAAAVTKLLNIPFDYPYETLYIGEGYKSKIIEAVPSSITVLNQQIDSVVVRMDFDFNESILAGQMQHSSVIIVTGKPINLELLKQFKPRIKQIFYIIDETHDSKFAIGVQKLGIPLGMFTYMREEELNKFKLEYLDIGLIQRREIKNQNQIKELEGVPVEKLFYKSAKTTLSNGSIFPSRAALLANKSAAHIGEICPVINNEEWWRELDYFMVLKLKD